MEEVVMNNEVKSIALHHVIRRDSPQACQLKLMEKEFENATLRGKKPGEKEVDDYCKVQPFDSDLVWINFFSLSVQLDDVTPNLNHVKEIEIRSKLQLFNIFLFENSSRISFCYFSLHSKVIVRAFFNFPQS